MVFIDDKFVGGCDDFFNKLNKGEVKLWFNQINLPYKNKNDEVYLWYSFTYFIKDIHFILFNYRSEI